MVRDRVVIGCQSQKVREKLIQEGSELTLEQAIDIARTYELAQEQLQTMVGEDRTVEVQGLNRKQNESKRKKCLRTLANGKRKKMIVFGAD